MLGGFENEQALELEKEMKSNKNGESESPA